MKKYILLTIALLCMVVQGGLGAGLLHQIRERTE